MRKNERESGRGKEKRERGVEGGVEEEVWVVGEEGGEESGGVDTCSPPYHIYITFTCIFLLM